MPELTERHLNIPNFLASKRAREGTWLHDDLAGAGTLALARALRNFDPALHPRGEGGLDHWLFYNVDKAISSRMDRWKKQGRLDREVFLTEELERRVPGVTVNFLGLRDTAVARIAPLEVALLEAKLAGFSQEDMADLTGMSLREVRSRMQLSMMNARQAMIAAGEVDFERKESRNSHPLGDVREVNWGGRRCRIIKVRMDGPQHRRWRRYAEWRWERANGPIPDGFRVKFLDGDTLNDDLSNLALTPMRARAWRRVRRKLAKLAEVDRESLMADKLLKKLEEVASVAD